MPSPCLRASRGRGVPARRTARAAVTYENFARYWPTASPEETLIAYDLIDEFQLMIDPVVLGGGKRLFADDGQLRSLHLVHSQPTTTGAIIATYASLR